MKPCRVESSPVRTVLRYPSWQGHGTVRTLENVEVAGEHPAQECLIADCGELPADTDLATIATYLTEVRLTPAPTVPCMQYPLLAHAKQ